MSIIIVKGRKSSDTNRDTRLFEWCNEFVESEGRTPTRKEAARKALELSNDPTFKASKGWLDKFSRKFDVEFTPLKVFPSRNKNSRHGSVLDSSMTDSVDIDSSSCYSGTPRVKDIDDDFRS